MSTPVSWRDHLLHATEVARLVPFVAEKIADPETKAVLLTASKEIGQHIERAIAKAELQMDALDPVNPPWDR